MNIVKAVSLTELRDIAGVLASEMRINILRLLSKKEMSLHEISRILEVPLSTVTANVKQLEDVGLVRCEMRPAKRGLKKICMRNAEKLLIDLNDEDDCLDSNVMIMDMPIGRFCEFEVHPTCGLAAASGIISYVDDPISFMDPEVSDAQLIWFNSGYLTYRYPNRVPQNATVTNLELSMEVCSEAPGFNPNWPSDIFVEINGVLLGVFTSPADFGGKRGLLNPAWWDNSLTQYGQQKRWTVTILGSYVDGIKLSNVTLKDLKLQDANAIQVRIGVKPDAKNVGGMNIFGRKFGNYEQDLRLKIEYAQ